MSWDAANHCASLRKWKHRDECSIEEMNAETADSRLTIETCALRRHFIPTEDSHW